MSSHFHDSPFSTGGLNHLVLFSTVPYWLPKFRSFFLSKIYFYKNKLKKHLSRSWINLYWNWMFNVYHWCNFWNIFLSGPPKTVFYWLIHFHNLTISLPLTNEYKNPSNMDLNLRPPTTEKFSWHYMERPQTVYFFVFCAELLLWGSTVCNIESEHSSAHHYCAVLRAFRSPVVGK